MSAALHIDRVRDWLVAQGWPKLDPDWLAYEDMGNVLAITNVEQNAPEWMFLRCGLITTSALNSIMTPSTNEYSKGARGLLARLIGERLLGEPYDWGNTGWTERGHAQEDEARKWYAVERGMEVRRVGFLLSKDGEEGGSPDGLVGDDGGVEIKCYGLEHHMRVVLGTDPFPESPNQVQGLLRITGRKWWDCVAYHPSPKIPNRLERVKRDDGHIAKLDTCMARAKKEMARAMERLEAMGTARIDSPDLSNLLDPPAPSDAELAEIRAGVERATELKIIPKKNATRMLGWIDTCQWQDLRDAWDALREGLEA